MEPFVPPGVLTSPRLRSGLQPPARPRTENDMPRALRAGLVREVELGDFGEAVALGGLSGSVCRLEPVQRSSAVLHS
eukprot:584149-Prymnesium_polylepis.3